MNNSDRATSIPNGLFEEIDWFRVISINTLTSLVDFLFSLFFVLEKETRSDRLSFCQETKISLNLFIYGKYQKNGRDWLRNKCQKFVVEADDLNELVVFIEDTQILQVFVQNLN